MITVRLQHEQLRQPVVVAEVNKVMISVQVVSFSPIQEDQKLHHCHLPLTQTMRYVVNKDGNPMNPRHHLLLCKLETIHPPPLRYDHHQRQQQADHLLQREVKHQSTAVRKVVFNQHLQQIRMRRRRKSRLPVGYRTGRYEINSVGINFVDEVEKVAMTTKTTRARAKAAPRKVGQLLRRGDQHHRIFPCLNYLMI